MRSKMDVGKSDSDGRRALVYAVPVVVLCCHVGRQETGRELYDQDKVV